MTQSEIMSMQRRVGTHPDGDWGSNSRAALLRHLREIYPKPNPWPKADDRSMANFYGPVGVKGGYTPLMKRVAVPYRMFLYTPAGERVKFISCHDLLADSLSWILIKIYDTYSQEDIERMGMHLYFGCFNPRAMRAGSRPSKHAWAAAIDFDMARNGLYTHWPNKAKMPLEIIEIFAAQGWINLGATISRDAMHFQATR